MSDDTNSSAIELFGCLIHRQGLSCITIGKELAARLEVPYHENRISGGKLLGYKRRVKPWGPGSWSSGPGSGGEMEGDLLDTQEWQIPDGAIVRSNNPPGPGTIQLTGEVWEQDPYWPDSFNDITRAMQKCSDGIVGVYWHTPSMNLVLLSASGEAVGIRSTSLTRPLEKLRPLAGLRKAPEVKGWWSRLWGSK